MLATALHSKYVSAGAILPQNDNRAADEAEIESLVLSCLPKVQDNQVFLLSAAKLLYFVDRGFRPMAAELIEKSAGTATALAISCAVLGQLRMFRGDLAAATALFENGLGLCRDDPEFELYLMVLACQARLAAADADGLHAAAERLYRANAATRPGLSFLYSVDGRTKLDPTAHAAIAAMSLKQAQGVLVWINYISARLFESPVHAGNIIRGVARLMVDRFGPGVIPQEIRETVPDPCAELAGTIGSPDVGNVQT